MILHIGNNITIIKNDILTILNRETIEESDCNKSLIDKLIQNGKLKNQIHEDIKSYIISLKDGEISLYISNISSNTLLKRKMI